MSFGSPAQDFSQPGLDLNQLLIRHPNGTYFVRMEGNAMLGGGIKDGDLLLVDRAIKVQSDNIVVCTLNKEFYVRKFKTHQDHPLLLAHDGKETKRYFIKAEDEFSIWGVVTAIIRPLDPLHVHLD